MFSFIVTSCNLHLGSICITDPVSTCNYLSVSVLAVEKIHVKVLQSVSVLKTFGCVENTCLQLNSSASRIGANDSLRIRHICSCTSVTWTNYQRISLTAGQLQ